MAGIFQRFRKGLAKTRVDLVDRVSALVKGRPLDEDFFEELEDILIQDDGVETSLKLVEK